MKKGEGTGPFEPNALFEGKIWGDLSNMLKVAKFRQNRYQYFSTDRYGFRNPEYPEGTYFPIVVAGDSDMVGSSLSDSETFARRLEKEIGLPVYNYADKSILHLLTDERFMKFPPKVIIWEAVERTIQRSNYQIFTTIPENRYFQINLPESRIDSGLPNLSKYLSTRLLHEIDWLFTGRLPESIGHVDEQSGMLFYKDGIKKLHMSAREAGVGTVTDGITRISRILARNGCNMIYMPLPDKEKIYRKLLPRELREGNDNQFLEILGEELDKKNVLNIKLYKDFLARGEEFARRGNSEDMLYFLDDTHWNVNGVECAVNKARDLMISRSLLNFLLLDKKQE